MKTTILLVASLLLLVAAPSAMAADVEVGGDATGDARLYCVGALKPWCDAWNATCVLVFSGPVCALLE